MGGETYMEGGGGGRRENRRERAIKRLINATWIVGPVLVGLLIVVIIILVVLHTKSR